MRECNQCGKCCIKFSNGGLSASADEIEYWEVFRPQIARYVCDGKIWMDPGTGDQIERCPWLREIPEQNKVTCDIYNDRPDDCRYYPVTVAEMIRDECEILETKDLKNPNQAQKNLDKIMADSRPAIE